MAWIWVSEPLGVSGLPRTFHCEKSLLFFARGQISALVTIGAVEQCYEIDLQLVCSVFHLPLAGLVSSCFARNGFGVGWFSPLCGLTHPQQGN